LCRSGGDSSSEIVQLGSPVACGLAQHVEGLIDAEVERAGEDTLRLFDRDPRTERRLKLCNPLKQEAVRVAERSVEGRKSVNWRSSKWRNRESTCSASNQAPSVSNSPISKAARSPSSTSICHEPFCWTTLVL